MIIKTASGSVYTLRKEGEKIILTRNGNKNILWDNYSQDEIPETREFEVEVLEMPELAIGERALFKTAPYAPGCDKFMVSPIVGIEGNL